MNQDIKEIAEDLGFTYSFEDWTRANVTLNGSRFGTLPVMLDVLPVAGRIDVVGSMLHTTTSRMVWLLDRINMDDSSERDWSVVEAMLEKAAVFIKRLNGLRKYGYVASWRWRAEYSLLDEKLGGICLEFDLVEITSCAT